MHHLHRGVFYICSQYGAQHVGTDSASALRSALRDTWHLTPVDTMPISLHTPSLPTRTQTTLLRFLQLFYALADHNPNTTNRSLRLLEWARCGLTKPTRRAMGLRMRCAGRWGGCPGAMPCAARSLTADAALSDGHTVRRADALRVGAAYVARGRWARIAVGPPARPSNSSDRCDPLAVLQAAQSGRGASGACAPCAVW